MTGLSPPPSGRPPAPPPAPSPPPPLRGPVAKPTPRGATVPLTRRIEVEYLRPVPLGQPLEVEGHIVRARGRAHYNRAELRDRQGNVLARGRGKFVKVDAATMFARELAKERRAPER